MKEKCLLIGDIGGTNARFALANTDSPGYKQVIELKCADYPTTVAAIRHYLDAIDAGTPDAVCLAAAGPVIDDAVNITNNDWDISVAAVRAEFDKPAMRLLNDFGALAYSIPFLAPDDSIAVGPFPDYRLPEGDFKAAILGPGTGLGIAGLYRRDERLVPITGEGGHVGFSPETPLQVELLQVIARKFDRVSTERLVAGSGLPDVYQALAVVRGVSTTPKNAAEIFADADRDEIAAETVEVFFEMLGQVAGDLSLTIGAFDAVYIAGGIAKRYPEILHGSRFRSAFESKGRFRHVMENVATRLIMHEQPGLLGAAYCALELVS